ncbi:spore germination protein [Peribacillus deserti]|uniref:Spore germination protein n=1 Tax=Peribacillus deserti TaxID=673318 RepID=A0ABS2QI76_9BACI|nr:germination protein YpeB [Peribacillus deserti]MBM7692665.1 spore germination protein [Peribacillus deserti]
MIRNIIIVVLALAIVGTGYWGYQEHQEKNAILVNSENNYQRAFHDLSYQVDLLHDKIGTSLAMNSRKSLSPALADVWRISSEANMDVGQLPLSLMAFNKTEEFLSNIGSFSYKAAVRDLEKEPLTDKEYKNLQGLYKQSNEIQNELRKVQYLVLKHNLRWMDVELALASGKENADNTIIDGFKTVENKSVGYSEKSDFDPSFTSMNKRENNFNHIKGKKISKEEAAAIAKKYTGIQGAVKTKVESNGKGSDFEFYSVSLSDNNTKNQVNMDITKKGGYPIWLINTRDVKDSRISLNEASNSAAKFLKENGFSSLELYESAQYNNTGVFNFVTNINGVRIYPDSIRVKIALDNGKVVGFSADDYLKGHKDRKIEKAALSVEKAKENISPKVQIMEDRLAYITNDMGEEVLCREFLGVIGEDTYRIFINAKTGQEEKVEKLQNAEPIYEQMV